MGAVADRADYRSQIGVDRAPHERQRASLEARDNNFRSSDVAADRALLHVSMTFAGTT